jgi:hypothetical protein
MNPPYIVATVSLVAGVLMLLFSRGIGSGFCLLGKTVFVVFKPIAWFWNLVSEVYDPAKAPKRFRILGWVFLIQAVALYILGSVLSE